MGVAFELEVEMAGIGVLGVELEVRVEEVVVVLGGGFDVVRACGFEDSSGVDFEFELVLVVDL